MAAIGCTITNIIRHAVATLTMPSRPVKISERTLYEPVIRFLATLGVRAYQEIGAQQGRGWTDVVCELDDGTKTVIELRFGKIEDRSTLIIDAVRHARQEHTPNLAAILYPEPPTRVLIDEDIDSLALDSKAWASCACEWWTKDLEGQVPVRDFLRQLFDPTLRKGKEIDFATVVSALQQEIEVISVALRKSIGTDGQESLAQVVGKFESFATLAGMKPTDKKALSEVKTAAIDLMAFILVNQLVFYRIYSERVGDQNLPKLPTRDATLQEVKNCIKAISDINYDPIYGIDVIGALDGLRERRRMVDEIGFLVELLPVLRPEQVSHDLLGRMLHDLLPSGTRNVLGAFFTDPEAGEVLAAMTLDRRNGLPERPKVVDPACGSGTLLVSAYRYFLTHEAPTNRASFHRGMNAERLTGIDVMPFAASMTAANLALQNPAVTITQSRIGMRDSLDLLTSSVIEPFSVSLQRTLVDLGIPQRPHASRREHGVVSAKGRGSPFTLGEPDCVMMNPPFTAWEDLPDEIRISVLRHSSLISLTGSTANLWQLFIALVYEWGRPGTVYGLVVPVNLFQGVRTERLRKLLYLNATVKSVVVNQTGIGFASSQQYRNVLMLFQKREPRPGDVTRVFHIRRNLKAEGLESAANLGRGIANSLFDGGEPPDQTVVLDVEWNQTNGLERLIHAVLSTATPEREIVERFYSRVISRGRGKLRPLDVGEIWEGFGPRPRGVSQIAIVRRETPGLRPPTPRTRQAGLVLLSESKREIRFRIKAQAGSRPVGPLAKVFTASKKVSDHDRAGLVRAIATIAGVRTIDIGQDSDYILLGPYSGWEGVRSLSSWSERKNKADSRMFSWKEIIIDPVRQSMTRLAVADALQQNSPDAFVLAVASDEPFAITNMQYGLTCQDAKEARFQALWLNSVVTHAFFATHQTGGLAGGLTRLKISEWRKHPILKVADLDSNDVKLLSAAWMEVSRRPLPSIMDQLRDPSVRIDMDRAILRVMGFTEKEANALLGEFYPALLAEIGRISERLGQENTTDTGQTHPVPNPQTLFDFEDLR